MALYVDTAVLEEAQWTLRLPCVSGLTCNPLLMSRGLEARQVTPAAYERHLSALADLVRPGGRIFIQVVRPGVEFMQAEAEHLIRTVLGPRRELSLTVKIPFTEEGLMAAQALSVTRVSVAVTGVFTPQQAYMAAVSGAEYVIPYVSRLETVGEDRLRVVQDMRETLKTQGQSCRVLAASVKSGDDFAGLLRLEGCDVTVPPELLRSTFDHAGVLEAVKRFEQAMVIG